MLRKIGIESFLVLEPGHCYVGFFLDEKREILLGLETTLVGADVEEPDELDEFLDESIEEELRGEYSWPSFVQSIESATEKLSQDAEKFGAADQHDYRFVDIAAARRLGVLPIAFDGKETLSPLTTRSMQWEPTKKTKKTKKKRTNSTSLRNQVRWIVDYR